MPMPEENVFWRKKAFKKRPTTTNINLTENIYNDSKVSESDSLVKNGFNWVMVTRTSRHVHLIALQSLFRILPLERRAH